VNIQPSSRARETGPDGDARKGKKEAPLMWLAYTWKVLARSVQNWEADPEGKRSCQAAKKKKGKPGVGQRTARGSVELY